MRDVPGDEFLEGREVVVGADEAKQEVSDSVLDVGVGIPALVRPDEDGAFDLVRVPPDPVASAVRDSTESVEIPPLVYNFSMLTDVDVSPVLVG
jgi:hypothetical protein